MTTEQAILEINKHLNDERVSESQYGEIIFHDEEATFNGKALFYFSFDNGGMDLSTLDHENICSLNMDELAEIFPSLYYQVYCEDCKGSHEDCDHDGVIYPL
jgi:hypothetical protein